MMSISVAENLSCRRNCPAVVGIRACPRALPAHRIARARLRRVRALGNGRRAPAAPAADESRPPQQQPPKADTARASGEKAELWEVRGSIRQQILPVASEAEAYGRSDGNAAADAFKSTGSPAVDAVRGLFIPRGYPEAVTPDYLPYQLVTFFTHVTGWMESSIATSSMLSAVGVGTGVAGATAATAALKWILKDGVGAAGRLFVGGGLSGYFDEEPRKWRMTGQFLSTIGTALEVATMMYPKSFLILAGSGVLAKSIGKGMGKPAFRVIQQHFSRANNVGDVAAKEEVWEVVGQLSGLAATVVVLRALERHQSAPVFLGTWALISLAHNYLRYASLKTLRFTGLNQKRACILVSASAAGLPIPGVDEANMLEPVLAQREQSSPSVEMGLRLSDIGELRLPGKGDTVPYSGGGRPLELEAVLAVFRDERYLLFWAQGRGRAVLKEGCSGTDKVKALWQAAWLENAGVLEATLEDLAASLKAANRTWPEFVHEAEANEWDLGDISIRTPDIYIIDRPLQ